MPSVMKLDAGPSATRWSPRPHTQADFAADAFAQKVCAMWPSGGARREPPRFQHQDAPPRGPVLGRECQGDPRGLAAALRRRHQDRGVVPSRRLRLIEVRQRSVDRKRRPVIIQLHRCQFCTDRDYGFRIRWRFPGMTPKPLYYRRHAHSTKSSRPRARSAEFAARGETPEEGAITSFSSTVPATSFAPTTRCRRSPASRTACSSTRYSASVTCCGSFSATCSREDKPTHLAVRCSNKSEKTFRTT